MSINKPIFFVLIASITVALPMVLASTSVSAQSGEINKCRVIQNNVKRLACLDNLFKRLDSEKPTNNSVETPPISSSEQVNQTNSSQSETDEIDKRAQALMTKEKKSGDPFSFNTPSLSTINKQQTKKLDDSFGAESMSKASDNEVEEMQMSVTDLVEDSRGYVTVTLSNEQVWRQTESTRFRLQKGELVIIERGVFQSFYLSKPNNNRRIRVKRIK
jgi:hypothetical protein